MDVAAVFTAETRLDFLRARFYGKACFDNSLKSRERAGTMRLWRKRSSSNHAATSVIDHGCGGEGSLSFTGTVAMNGKFRGEMFTADTLFLGAEGEVEAEVQVTVGIISGQVKGNITGRERIELTRSARIFGNIVTPILVLEEGAMFDGQCKASRHGEEPLE